jgi:hypothetical protein
MIAGIQNHSHFCKPPTALPLSVSLYDCREVSLYGCPEKHREDGEHIAVDWTGDSSASRCPAQSQK